MYRMGIHCALGVSLDVCVSVCVYTCFTTYYIQLDFYFRNLVRKMPHLHNAFLRTFKHVPFSNFIFDARHFDRLSARRFDLLFK